MTRKIRRFDCSPDEWIAGCIGMSLEEEGLYTRIIMRYYSRGNALPADPREIAKLCNVHPQIAQRVLAKIAHKFDQTSGKLRQNRCEVEIKLAAKRRQVARVNGAKGGRPKDLAKPDGFERDKARARVPSLSLPLPLKKKDSPPSGGRAPNGRAAAPDDEINEKGVALLGSRKRGLIRQMRLRFGDERVWQALIATERREHPDPVAYFCACFKQGRGTAESTGPPAEAHAASPPPKPVNPKFLGHGDHCMCSNCQRWQFEHNATE